MVELPPSARIARIALRFLIIPMVIIGIAVRFTAPGWTDVTFLILLAIAVVLVVVGRVFEGNGKK
jgi:hypothetical protein